jgi:hypothetical protein
MLSAVVCFAASALTHPRGIGTHQVAVPEGQLIPMGGSEHGLTLENGSRTREALSHKVNFAGFLVLAMFLQLADISNNLARFNKPNRSPRRLNNSSRTRGGIPRFCVSFLLKLGLVRIQPPGPFLRVKQRKSAPSGAPCRCRPVGAEMAGTHILSDDSAAAANHIPV